MTRLLLTIHIAGGAAALLSMPFPLLSRKGGPAHRRAGWVFVAGMALVCITALLLSAIRFLTDSGANGREFSILLFYIAILTGSGMWGGMRVLRAKHRVARGPMVDIAVCALLAGSGVLTAAYGLASGRPLFIAFSLIGVVNGTAGLRYWLRRPTVAMHWWLAHMGNMLGACIAAVTAFAIAGGRRIGLPGDSLITWLGPTAIGLPIIAIWIAYYRRRFASPRGRAAALQHAAGTIAGALAVVLAISTSAPAQTLPPGTGGDAFEVASVKPSMNGPRVPLPRIRPGGQLEIIGVTLRDLIRMAYPARAGQVLVEGGAGWVTSDRFDVIARTTDRTRPSMRMLRGLLEDRFKLQVRRSTREGTVYALVLARSDGRFGPSLQPAACPALDSGQQPAGRGRPQRMTAGEADASVDCSSLRIGAGPTFFGRAVTMARLAAFLSEFPMLSAPVIDRTGLTGTYDFQLRTRAENNPNPEAGALMPVALQEQLGLKLERSTGPVDVVAIESADRPGPD